MLVTLILMYFGGISINTMSLGGLTVGIGMVVDNSNVVLENILVNYHRDRTRDKKEVIYESTTELIGHLHRTAGRPVVVAGNVGTPLASLVGAVDPEATVVCEASSFQLEDTSYFSPECAVFINLAPDHLDRHGNLESYLEAKLRILANQGNDDAAVFNGDTPELRDRDLGGCARRIRFCPAEGESADPDCELSMRDGVIFAADEPLLRADELQLLGGHNVENAMAAAAAALASGLPRDAVAEGLRSFRGVTHRLERVRELGGVLYVNDSKATNVASAVAGVRAFDGSVRLIAGGRPKQESFAPLAEAVRERCVAVYLIGEAAERMAEELQGTGVEIDQAGTLEGAVEAASAAASPGEVVLLSPAAASFDAFKDFEARGDRFRELVKELG
jgi:UDP-N-acetylmuramoylalanine--D-glutamate ligase